MKALEQRVVAVCVAYLAFRVASGGNFAKNVVAASVAFVGYVCHSSLRLEPAVSVQVCGVALGVSAAATAAFRSAADLLVVACVAGALSKPEATSLDGDTLRQALVAAKEEEEKKAPTFWDRAVQRAKATFEDLVASLASQAADVAFVDLTVALVAKVSLPPHLSEKKKVFLIGCFDRWLELPAKVGEPLFSGARSHKSSPTTTSGEHHQRRTTMLVRIPPDYRPPRRLAVAAPDGTEVDFVPPPGALPGSLVMISV
mmetsp:Transcript_16527/g.53807  ORF Transcript_16527/g.53807 Transcript_16527/m.53807 type:complete len:257 (-) Transcript_16527:513-1283(-)